MISNKAVFLLTAFMTCLSCLPAAAQKSVGPGEPVAVVGDNPIWQRQVEWEFNRKFGDKDLDDVIANTLRYKIMMRLIKQHVILDKFRGTEIYATDDEVKLEISKMKERLNQIDLTLDGYLEENKTNRDDLKFNLRWQLSWAAYLEKTLNDEVLEKYYTRHSRRFDGTRMKVSHLLLSIPVDADQDRVDAIMKQASQLKSKVEDGSLRWADAVAENSAGSTASKGGSIGEIGIDGPMPVAFTKVAMQLNEGKISKPVRTQFGVHLIRCDDLIIGHRNWYDCKEEVRQAATEELFERVVKKHKGKVQIYVSADAPKKPKK